MSDERQGYVTPLGDLVDLLTVTCLRLSNSAGENQSLRALREALIVDIDSALRKSNLKLSTFLSEVVALAQVNQQIWLLKDSMASSSPGGDEYTEALVMAHQLNGVRNQIRNKLTTLDATPTPLVRSNTETDGLGKEPNLNGLES